MLMNNMWVKASGNLQEKPISIQFRDECQKAVSTNSDVADFGEYQVCVQIAWNAESRDDSNGFPSLAEQERILLFNDQLQLHLEGKENAILAMMITHDGVNQWVIYCRDLEKLQKDLEKIPTDNGLYPIEIVADDDPEWQVFKKVYGQIDTSEPITSEA
ncbi:MAG: DUF695 domain-containing protein [Oleibacter sp.]|nr:DUF695 domain-containing protein [Thalassolituus sp.]